MQELGIQTTYSNDDATYRFIRKLMVLPFLPHHEIRAMFLRLCVQAQTQPLRSLTNYIKEQWIKSTIFAPKDWSVFKEPIQTNNALNRRASGQ